MSDKKYIAPPGRSAGFKHYLVGLWKYTGSLRKRAYFDIVLIAVQGFLIFSFIATVTDVTYLFMLDYWLNIFLILFLAYLNLRLAPFIKAAVRTIFKIGGAGDFLGDMNRAYDAAAAGGDIVTGYSGWVGYSGNITIRPDYNYAHTRGSNARWDVIRKYWGGYVVLPVVIIMFGWLIGWPCAMWYYHKQTQSSQQ